MAGGGGTLEPQARNTAACIGLGALEILRRDAEAVMAVVPSDQYVTQLEPFRASVQQALDRARLGPKEIHVVPGDFGWSDVGSWNALSAVADQDASRNTTVGSRRGRRRARDAEVAGARREGGHPRTRSEPARILLVAPRTNSGWHLVCLQ
jgi:mannose-1-phosphate guanylyltransferase